MKKIIGILTFVAIVAVASPVSAQMSNFNVSLNVGSTNKAEVLKLQQFLFDNGYLTVAPTGNYLSLTKKAVVAFQSANGVTPASGYFGPITRAAANSRLANGPTATISVSSISKNTNTASAVLANQRSVNWQTTNYPQGLGVDIKLIRKVAGSSESFSLIRYVVKDTANDGTHAFTLQNSELGNDVYVEVACSTTIRLNSGCAIGSMTKVN